MIFVHHYKPLICASNEIFEVLNCCHFVAAIFGYNNPVSLESCVALILLTPAFLNSKFIYLNIVLFHIMFFFFFFFLFSLTSSQTIIFLCACQIFGLLPTKRREMCYLGIPCLQSLNGEIVMFVE
jgi:hypothetical protein